MKLNKKEQSRYIFFFCSCMRHRMEEQAVEQAKSFHRRPKKVAEWFRRHKKNAAVLAISTALVVGSAVYMMTNRVKDVERVVQKTVGGIDKPPPPPRMNVNSPNRLNVNSPKPTGPPPPPPRILVDSLKQSIVNNATEILGSDMPTALCPQRSLLGRFYIIVKERFNPIEMRY